MVKTFNWLVLSSADANKLSATITGSIWFTIISTIATLMHIDGFSNVADHGISFLVGAGQFISAAYALYGAIRKVKRTVGGTNAVLNDQLL